eukprot:TRINITY_DN2596_c0_g1_i3.p1 TRINITY_DN2596_c0_g1~~TRINITY_DN2596_c0_g1_i3.p1  ORF type:complete len:150 (+),score=8.45 TRINITY_DN2596_c0_g1_i3:270-719(+)
MTLSGTVSIRGHPMQVFFLHFKSPRTGDMDRRSVEELCQFNLNLAEFMALRRDQELRLRGKHMIELQRSLVDKTRNLALMLGARPGADRKRVVQEFSQVKYPAPSSTDVFARIEQHEEQQNLYNLIDPSIKRRSKLIESVFSELNSIKQ